MRKKNSILFGIFSKTMRTITYIYIFFALWFLYLFYKLQFEGTGFFNEIKHYLPDKLQEKFSTTKSIFGGRIEIEELPQHHIETDKVKLFDEMQYRAFNPSIALWNGILLKSYRLSNYVDCGVLTGKTSFDSMKKPENKNAKSFIMLSIEDKSGRNKVLYLDTPDFTLGDCVTGFEDPRLITSPDGKTLYIVVNARSNLACFAEMHLIKISTDSLYRAFESKFLPRIMKIEKDQIIKLIESKSPQIPIQSQKNWMPFFDGENLMFIYSVNPHIILKCDLKTGICTKVAETSNANVNPSLRGSSQARYYKGKFIAVAHWRLSSHSYLSQAYTFSASSPYAIEKVSPAFVIDDEDEMAPTCIQFVSGFEIEDDIAYITYGEYDCDSKMMKVDMKTLLNSMTPV